MGAVFSVPYARLAPWPQALAEVRGAGLMWGLDLDRPALPVVEAALQHGLLVNRTAETVVRLLPPWMRTVPSLMLSVPLLTR